MKPFAQHQVVIIGGGAAGISVAASLLQRNRHLDIAIVEPNETHYYQPAWTLVGGGAFRPAATRRAMHDVIPRGVKWIRAAAAGFHPDVNRVELADGEQVGYDYLIVAPGIRLGWDRIEGLVDTLGANGVTSNYGYKLAPYTWELVQNLKSGRALFTQPPMPIKCAGAPQKAMYLSCDAWRRRGVLDQIDVSFHNAGAVLFGVEAYVPALMEYIKRYDISLNFNESLVAIDGPAKKAWFERKDAEGKVQRREDQFDMIHVVPPQSAPDFVANSPLADVAGWVDVDQESMRHKRYANIYGLGDACNAPNAKTAAAVRQQVPVVAHNLIRDMGKTGSPAYYTGYGSCPLTVQRGKIVLAEFGYGGKLEPTFPTWFLQGMRPTWKAWFLKKTLLPPIYWHLMLKGREWLAKPKLKQETATNGASS